MTFRIMKLLEKTSRKFEAVVFLIALLLTAPSVKGKGGCRLMDFLACEKNRTLIHHVIKSFRTSAPGIEDCQQQCYLEGKCVSYNLGPVKGTMTSCELNDGDHWVWPQHVVPNEGFEYCPIKNSCSSSPCSSNKICIPDFAWDTFACVDSVWTQWTSWTPCLLSDCPRNRTRNCIDLLESQSSECSGPPLETKECEIPTTDIRTGCESPLGMENGSISDSQVTASSMQSSWIVYAAKEARLNNQHRSVGAWVPRSVVGEYIQVDLGGVKKVTKIATQGRHSGKQQWVTEYRMSYSNDTEDWINYQKDCVKTFPGNSDNGTVFTNPLEMPIIARYIHVIVQDWHGHPAMRMELYGCTP